MRVIRGLRVGDLVEAQLIGNRRGVGIIVKIINEKFKPLMLEVCFPATKSRRKKIIKLKASKVKVLSETR